MRNRSSRQRFALTATFGVALSVVAALVYAFALGSGNAATAQVLAGFEARSYAPGEVAALRIDADKDPARRVAIQFFLVGAGGTDVAGLTRSGWDRHTFGKPVGRRRFL